MGFETRVGTRYGVGRVWVRVKFEAPMQNPYPRYGFQRVWPWPGQSQTFTHSSTKHDFSNNRLQNIEQKHTSTILNIAGFFLSGPFPPSSILATPLCV